MYNIVNEDDFKYTMQDVSKYYFGARLSYTEILADEMAPFKFKTIVERYIVKDMDPATTLESHLYYLAEEDFQFQVFKQLKAKVRVSQLRKGSSDHYQEKVYTMNQLAAITPSEKEEAGMIVRELIVSKLALFAFSV
ncbi:hypothetical protein [Butyrivibrio sp. INlla16]|uniref:hypothetical protein n=1 Tax=Butyrivibrio sp. INlla16 TaxID=1520807 RepID=UPI00088949B6|nr:hypothetical protein [Butyrivibrio sp. INlla16]SDB38806.1 hypothetical protein SAMN02910263_01867 [Butyrivibrio sp. INlla16]